MQSARLCDCGIEMVEPMGIAPTEILLAKQTPLLHSDHGPIVNPIVNYTKLVDSAGLEPPIDVIARTNYVSTVYKTASLRPIEVKS